MRLEFHLFTLLLCTALLGCKSNEFQSDSFDYSHSVDLSYILQAYEWQQNYKGDDEYTILWSKITPEIPEDEFYLFEDTSFVLRVPEYANSKQPFLANAEDFYNSFSFAWNIYSKAQSQIFCEIAPDYRIIIGLGYFTSFTSSLPSHVQDALAGIYSNYSMN